MNRFAAFAVLALLTAPAAAQPATPDLYAARTIVTGTDDRSRGDDLDQTLRDVLIKVSGDPALLGDPRVDALAAHADAMAEDFWYIDRESDLPHHDEQGSRDRPYDLTVHFAPARVNAALARAIG